ncbi:MAG: 6-phosphofructokinase [Clostridiales bacterium]|nr:6-phosphofructokinase [Clostridiales bacterium]
MIQGNFAVAQSGGPTSAINATLCGVIEGAFSQGRRIYGAVNGILGVINDSFTDLNITFSNMDNIQLLKTTPSAYLGSCRYKLPASEDNYELYEKIFSNFKKHDVTMFIYIGGNDSMDTVRKLSAYSKKYNKGVYIVGVPKTIDNDLMNTDHTPGFGSAAKFVATAVSEIARDCAVYADPSITVIEIMGRNAGWLTAASALARSNTSDAPHLIYLPEKQLSVEKLINDVESCKARNMVIAVSEGIKNENGEYFSNLACNISHDEFGHAQLSGSARVVENILKEKFGIKTRSVELNVLQRCSSHFASRTDLDESVKIGKAGASAASEGMSGIVMGFKRTGNYSIDIITNNATDVANLEKKVPDSYISRTFNDVTDDFIEYCLPLVQGEPSIITEKGIPKHIAL